MHPLNAHPHSRGNSPMQAWRMLPPGGAPLALADIRRALRGAFAGEEALYALRQAFSRRFDMPHVLFAGSGREALSLLFTVLRGRVRARDTVLIPAYVSWSVPSAVVHAGCRIALYDVEPLTLTPRLESLQNTLADKALSGRVLAVVACHLYGFPFDLAPLADACRATGAVLVDDAAQAMGATVNGACAGCMGDVGLFSLGRGKNITAVQGGVLLTRNGELAERLAAHAPRTGNSGPGGVREHMHNAAILLKACALFALRRPELYRLPASLPWLRLGESVFDPAFGRAPFGSFQATLALHTLKGLDAANRERREKAALYSASLPAGCGLMPVAAPQGALPVYPRFPILPEADAPSGRASPARSAAIRALDANAAPANARGRGLGISRGFPLPVHAIADARPYLTQRENIHPGAEYLARHLFTLPTHDGTGNADCAAALAYAVDACSDLYRPYRDQAEEYPA